MARNPAGPPNQFHSKILNRQVYSISNSSRSASLWPYIYFLGQQQWPFSLSTLVPILSCKQLLKPLPFNQDLARKLRDHGPVMKQWHTNGPSRYKMRVSQKRCLRHDSQSIPPDCLIVPAREGGFRMSIDQPLEVSVKLVGYLSINNDRCELYHAVAFHLNKWFA